MTRKGSEGAFKKPVALLDFLEWPSILLSADIKFINCQVKKYLLRETVNQYLFPSLKPSKKRNWATDRDARCTTS